MDPCNRGLLLRVIGTISSSFTMIVMLKKAQSPGGHGQKTPWELRAGTQRSRRGKSAVRNYERPWQKSMPIRSRKEVSVGGSKGDMSFLQEDWWQRAGTCVFSLQLNVEHLYSRVRTRPCTLQMEEHKIGAALQQDKGWEGKLVFLDYFALQRNY